MFHSKWMERLNNSKNWLARVKLLTLHTNSESGGSFVCKLAIYYSEYLILNAYLAFRVFSAIDMQLLCVGW